MASHPDFVNYVAEQLREAGAIRSRKMFGEYGLYCDDVFFAVICDDQFFVKPTPQGEAAFPNLPDVYKRQLKVCVSKHVAVCVVGVFLLFVGRLFRRLPFGLRQSYLGIILLIPVAINRIPFALGLPAQSRILIKGGEIPRGPHHPFSRTILSRIIAHPRSICL